jgi:hypothetical protein
MADAEAAIRRRFRAVYLQLDRFGATDDVAKLVASVVTHLETHGHVRIEHHEVAALAGVIGLICRCQQERAARDGALAELAEAVG